MRAYTLFPDQKQNGLLLFFLLLQIAAPPRKIRVFYYPDGMGNPLSPSHPLNRAVLNPNLFEVVKLEVGGKEDTHNYKLCAITEGENAPKKGVKCAINMWQKNEPGENIPLPYEVTSVLSVSFLKSTLTVCALPRLENLAQKVPTPVWVLG